MVLEYREKMQCSAFDSLKVLVTDVD